MKDLLLSIFLTFCIFFIATCIGKYMAFYIDKTIFEEIHKFREFRDDPHNIGRYIQDFDTGTWYDIDGLNPDVAPLTIKEMSIKNIAERIMKMK